MALDKKISDLTQGTPGDNDWIPYVDISAEETKKSVKSELKGDKGDAATVDVGTTTTGDEGTPAEVVNSGTTSDAIFDFNIPKGDTGDTGPQGPQGDTGNGIDYIARTNGDGSSGTTDTYTIYYTDGTTTTFDVYNGADGREVELQANSTHIQWRYLGETTWNDIIALSELEGPEGPQGPEGPEGLVWQGAYDSGITYVIDDAVSYNGSSYICIQETTGNLPTNTAYWEVLAQKGIDGEGFGDMTKATYDTDDNGLVDNADYDNSTSGLTATDMNSAVDEVEGRLTTVEGEYITASSTNSLTNKTIDLTDNIIQGTIAEFNTACEDGTFAFSGDNISIFNNDSGYITDYTVTNSDLTGLNNSELNNDSGYITDITSELLSDLSDVAASSPSDGQALVYNSTSGDWENQDVSGGSGTISTLDILEIPGTQTTGVISTYRAPQSGTISEFKAYVETAPSGSDLTIDLIKNGIVIATATISAGTNSTDVTSFSDDALSEDDKLEYEVTNIGTVTAGADMTLSIKLS